MLSTTLLRRLDQLDRLTNGRLGPALIDGRRLNKSYATLVLEVRDAFGITVSVPTIQRWHDAYMRRAETSVGTGTPPAGQPVVVNGVQLLGAPAEVAS